MKARAASPDVLVDLNGLDELKGIELAGDGTLTIGAMTTYTELIASRRGAGAPDPRRGLRDDRGRPGAEPRHDRRQRLLERPDEPPAAAACARSARRFTIVSRERRAHGRAAEFFLGVYMTAVGAGRAADEDHDPRRQAGRLRRGHARCRRHVHRERGREHQRPLRVALGCVDAVPVVVEPRVRPTASSEAPCATRPRCRRPTSTRRASTARTSPRCSRCAPPARQPERS